MSTGTDLVPADTDAAVDDVQRQVAVARAQAEAIEVHDEESATLATGVLRDIQRRRKAAEAKRREYVDPLNATVKQINADFKAAMAPFEEADEIVRRKVQGWTDEQERVRQEEAARLERERQEREQKIRQQREAQEAQTRAEQEAREKEAREAEELATEDPDLQVLADEAREKAQEAATAADAIAALPEVELPTAVVQAPAKPEGISTPKRWEFTIVDPSEVPDEFKVVDEVALRKHMRDVVKDTGKPPEVTGVEFEQVAGLAVRG